MLYAAQQDGRISHPVWLKVDASIMLDPNVRFSIGVAYQNGVEVIEHERAADQIDFEVLFARTDWNDPEIQRRLQIGEKTEVLVPDIVPLNMISWR
jgi:ssDNA thymidine ADP-ribosyltransferase, DarT